MPKPLKFLFEDIEIDFRELFFYLSSMLMKLRGDSFKGFSRIDLLACLLLLLPFMLMTAAGDRNRAASQGVVCLSNHKNLTAAWHAFAEAHGGALLRSEADFNDPDRPVWVTGNLDFSNAPNNWEPNETVNKSPLKPFLPNKKEVWRCPADQSSVHPFSTERGKFVGIPRIRSYSMSGAFGAGFWLPAPPYRTFARFGDIRNTAHTFVFLDEHPDSINDGLFSFQGVAQEAAKGNIVDFPANFHEHGSTFSFSDGHTEIHVWKGAKIQPPASYGKRLLALNVPAGDSLKDIIWLSANGSERR